MRVRRVVAGMTAGVVLTGLLAAVPAQAAPGGSEAPKRAGAGTVVSPQSGADRLLTDPEATELNPPEVALPASRAGAPAPRRSKQSSRASTSSLDGGSTSQLAAAGAAPSVPTDGRAEDLDSYTPVVSVLASDPDGGTLTTYFNVRRPSSSTWDIAEDAAVSGASGQRVSFELPADTLGVGAAFQWQARSCDADGSCSAWTTASKSFLNPALGAGARRNDTMLDFPVGDDRLYVGVNVGTGGLVVRSTDLVAPGVNESLTLGAAYSSNLLGGGSGRVNNDGSHGYAWRTGFGADIELLANDNGSVTYVAAGGTVSLFEPQPGSSTAYVSPGEVKGDLTKTPGGWSLQLHEGTRLDFTAAGKLTASTDRNGNTVTIAYTGQEMDTITATAGPTGARQVSVSYDADGRITGYARQISSAKTITVGYGYDETSNDLVSITDPLGRVTRFGYDGHDITPITNPGGDVTTLTYDRSHRVTSLTQVTDAATGAGSTTRLVYNGDRVLVADANTDLSATVYQVPHTEYIRNLDARIASVTDPAGNTRARTYTPFADIATSSGATPGSTTENTYGANGGESLTSTQAPTGATSSLAYGAAANAANPTAPYQPTSATNPRGEQTTYTYNGAGNRASSTDTAAATASVDYNPDGTIAASTDPGNQASANATTYAYTDHQLTSITPPTGTTLGVRTLTYDNFGRLKTYATGGGATTTYRYDDLGRTTKIFTNDYALNVTYTYDAAGNLATTTTGGTTVTNTYDPLHRLTGITRGGQDDTSYGYDPAGNLTTLTDARGTTTYTYDTRNLLATMSIDTGNGGAGSGTATSVFGYDADARRTDAWHATDGDTTTPPAGYAMHQATSYDTSGRITRITTRRDTDGAGGSNATTVSDVSYCYSAFVPGQDCPTGAAGSDTDLRQYQVDELTGTRSDFSYTVGRLVEATNYAGKTYTYGYDASANRTSASDGTTTQTLTYNSGNQITTTGYDYDGAGNLTTTPEATYTYNSANQTTAVTTGTGPSAASTTFGYNGPDQIDRTTRTGGSYLNGQLGVEATTTGTGGTAVTDYIARDPATGQPLALHTTDGQAAYYATDATGSTTHLITATGDLGAAYTYDPYGVTLSATGTWAARNLIRYAAGTTDPDTNLVKFGLRYYHPHTGRFTQQDAIERPGDLTQGNRYTYAACNPINYTDPTGAHAEEIAELAAYLAACGSGARGVLAAGASAAPALVAATGISAVGLGAIGALGGCGLGIFGAALGFPTFADAGI